jgi:hypothetical protein
MHKEKQQCIMNKLLIAISIFMLTVLTFSIGIALKYIDAPLNEYGAKESPGFYQTTWEEFVAKMEARNIYYSEKDRLFISSAHNFASTDIKDFLDIEILADYYGYGGNLSEHIDIKKTKEKPSIVFVKPNLTWDEFQAKLEYMGYQYDPINKIFTEPNPDLNHDKYLLTYRMLERAADDFGYSGDLNKHFSNENLSAFLEKWSIKQDVDMIFQWI